MKMKLIENQATRIKAIASIGRRGVKLDKEIQVIAASIVAHIEKYGDYTECQRLMDAIQGKGRKVAIAAYFTKYAKVDLIESKVMIEGKEKTVKEFKFNRDKKTDLDGAMENLWTDSEPEPKPAPLDFKARVISILKAADKHIEKPVEGDLIDQDLYNSLANIVGYTKQAANA